MHAQSTVQTKIDAKAVSAQAQPSKAQSAPAIPAHVIERIESEWRQMRQAGAKA